MSSRLSAAVFVSALALGIATSCTKAAKSTVQHPPSPANSSHEWIDIKPGWRIRAVTSLQKSGSTVVRAEQTAIRQTNPGRLDVDLKAADDFIGYEVSFYSVRPRGGTGVSVSFESAERIANGVTTPQATPAYKLFQIPDRLNFVRILYLTRSSASNYDAAIVAVRDMKELPAVTARIQANPAACKSARNLYCEWIPAGIAVRPERFNGSEWKPAA